MKKLLYLLLILGALLGIERLSHSLTDGFGLPNITSKLPYNPAWDVPIAADDLEELTTALSERYHYLASGSQSYVFISADGNYILKFFKHKRWRMHPFYEALPLPPSLEAKRKRWKQKKEETVQATFASCILSYLHFRNETGLFYVHLNPTSHLKRTLIVKDRLGLTHKIPLDTIPFLMQKRAIPTDQYLLSLKKTGDLKKAQQAIDDLLHFTLYRAQKGYSDKDPHLIRNFGFIKDHVVEIDVGGFHHDPKKELPYYYSHEIFRIQKKIIPWLDQHYPELSPYAETKIQEMIEHP
ncbi:MAG: hypothetical protein AB7N99_04140 [Simkaniaceae bacterium]